MKELKAVIDRERKLKLQRAGVKGKGIGISASKIVSKQKNQAEFLLALV